MLLGDAARSSAFTFGFLASAMLVVLGVILFSPEEVRLGNQSLTVVGTSGSAAVTSILFMLKLRRSKDQLSTVIAFLSLGVILWLVAEGIWSFYVLVLEIEVPYPSVPDIFYLAGYLPVGYSLYLLTRNTTGILRENRLVITTIAITLTAFITNVFLLEIVGAAIGFTQVSSDEIVLLIMSVSYPLLDGFLFVPAIIAFYAFRRSREHLTWLLLSAAMLVMVAADTGFGYTALVELDALTSDATWDILFNFSYALLAAAMINGLLTHGKSSDINPSAVKTRVSDAAVQ